MLLRTGLWSVFGAGMTIHPASEGVNRQTAQSIPGNLELFHSPGIELDGILSDIGARWNVLYTFRVHILEMTQTTDPTRASDARERLLQTAIRLFGEEGIRATGIDRLLAEAGVAKMTLYKHFGSKDDLVVAALRRKDELFRETFAAMVGLRTDPRARLLGVFDALERWFSREDYRGCLFLNAAAELADCECCGREAIAEHKAWVLGQLRTLAGEAGAGDPGALADQLMLLFEGAIVRSYVTGRPDVARDARRAAAVLLDGAAGVRS